MRRRKRRIWRKLAGLLAAAVLASVLAGCGNTATEGTSSPQTENDGGAGETAEATAASGSAMGRYMENTLALPEEPSQVMDMRVMEDGTLRILIADAKGQGAVYTSADNGATWEKTLSLAQSIEDNAKEQLYLAALSPDGSVFCVIYIVPEQTAEEGVLTERESATDGHGYRYEKTLPDGTVKAVTLQTEGTEGDYIEQLSYASAGSLLLNWIGDSRIYEINDETGELQTTYNTEGVSCDYYYRAGDHLYLISPNGITVLDCGTGEEIQTDAALTDTLEQDKSKLEFTSFGFYPVCLCAGTGEGELYYCTEDGIFRYQQGGQVVEQLADGKLNSLSKPSVMLRQMVALPDGSLLVDVCDMSADISSEYLLRFAYNAQVPTVPETEIRVYALQESKDVQQAVALFQAQNPDYYVSLETGVSEDSSVTASDALRTLNTQILAGDGPDVLILDGMPLDTYMEKGMLTDLSDLYGELTERGEIFEGIAGAWKTEDGALYAIPTRFRIPVLVGEETELSGILSLEDLARAAAALREGDSKTRYMVKTYSIYSALYLFYGVCSPGFAGADGSFDEEAVREFLAQTKSLFDQNLLPEDEAEKARVLSYEKTDSGDSCYIYAGNIDSIGFLMDMIRLQELELGSGSTYATMAGVCEKKNLSWKYAPLSEEATFEPRDIVGISSSSAQKEAAKTFVRFLLSEDAQKSGQGYGFPVNVSAFDAELFADKTEGEELYTAGSSWTDENGTYQELTYTVSVPSAAEREKLTEIAKTLDTPMRTDTVMQDFILEYAGKYLGGEMELEEAVAAIRQKMDLYLAE